MNRSASPAAQPASIPVLPVQSAIRSLAPELSDHLVGRIAEVVAALPQPSANGASAMPLDVPGLLMLAERTLLLTELLNESLCDDARALARGGQFVPMCAAAAAELATLTAAMPDGAMFDQVDARVPLDARIHQLAALTWLLALQPLDFTDEAIRRQLGWIAWAINALTQGIVNDLERVALGEHKPSGRSRGNARKVPT